MTLAARVLGTGHKQRAFSKTPKPLRRLICAPAFAA
jgi:hypothetical protein